MDRLSIASVRAITACYACGQTRVGERGQVSVDSAVQKSGSTRVVIVRGGGVECVVRLNDLAWLTVYMMLGGGLRLGGSVGGASG